MTGCCAPDLPDEGRDCLRDATEMGELWVESTAMGAILENVEEGGGWRADWTQGGDLA